MNDTKNHQDELCEMGVKPVPEVAGAFAEYIRADLARPKVKPLVWSHKGYAPTPFGKYLVVCEEWTGEDEPFWFLCFAGKPYAAGGEHGTEESAKAAAQADYERRILEALE